MYKQPSTKLLASIILILLLIVYTQYYMKYAPGYKILQSSLSKIDVSTIFEKHPIIITERIVNPLHLTTTLFKWIYAFKQTYVIQEPNVIICSHHKYCILHNNGSDMMVNIMNPIYKKQFKPYTSSYGMLKSTKQLQDSNAQYVTIKLKKQQCMILPMHWIYESDRPHGVILLDDVVTIIIVVLIHLFNSR